VERGLGHKAGRRMALDVVVGVVPVGGGSEPCCGNMTKQRRFVGSVRLGVLIFCQGRLFSHL
jgi:hypothetical protein